ncbi:ferredoxin [Rhodococcus rhodochrous]|uniref:ferredoxin n=1 Tax=Rhodococcus rhodochrous TaxID=1829 RepID=UPI001E3A69BA|nr:ferredoxin [Rhodococcus rhodochrous]MCB8914164.1 ferredoxin [Rhodococcus rhodochrous]
MSAELSVNVDMGRCEYHGQCVFAAPDHFDINDDDELVYDEHPDASNADLIRAAAEACPVQAITVSTQP